MVTYIKNPKFKLTLGSTEYESEKGIVIQLIRVENGFDTSTIFLSDYQSSLYPDVVTAGASVQVDIKDASDDAYTTKFKGICRFPILPLHESEILQLKCDGTGYGFGDTVCANEYGVQSKNPTLDTIKEILTDEGNGLVPKYVNKVMLNGEEEDSGFSYTTTYVDTITGSIPYVYFPYKPSNKALDDLCDLVTAIKAETAEAGPHWIVDTSDNLRVKLITSNQSGWTKYCGGSQTEATLEQGKDFTEFQFEKMGPEANHIIYYGTLRKPNGELWTESLGPGVSGADLWWRSEDTTFNNAPFTFIIGSSALFGVADAWKAGVASIPSSRAAQWNFTNTGSNKNPPLVNFYVFEPTPGVEGLVSFVFRLETIVDTSYFQTNLLPSISTVNKWIHFSLPIGPYYKSNLQDEELFEWTVVGSPSPSWDQINCATFIWQYNTMNNGIYIDDLNFEGTICRVAYNSTSIANNKLKTKVITDNVGKDDSLLASDDAGTLAQTAYAELLRLQKTSLVGQVTVPLIKHVLPGQLFHIHAKKKSNGTFNIDSDMRITRIIDVISAQKSTTTLELTDDLTNSHARAAYENYNRLQSAIRPDFQDRQATSIKAGIIDITVPRLEKDYPS